MDYHFHILRKLLLNAFSQADLKRHCQNYPALQPLKQEFEGLPFGDMVDQALDYCQRHVLVADLVEMVKTENPAMFRIFEPKLFKKQINLSNLQTYLFNLNRDDHVLLFSQKMRHVRGKAASFLIHGQAECGQDVLVRRLIQQSVDGRYRDYQPYDLYLGRRGVRRLDSIWRELYRLITGIGGSVSADMVIEKLLAVLQTRDIIIVLHDLHLLSTDDWNIILHEFWHVVVPQVETTLTQHRGRLLLILVDWEGVSAKWEACHDPHHPRPDYRHPIKLPEVGYFKREDLEYWLDDLHGLVPTITVDQLLEQTEGGVPYLVYDWLCALCETSPDDVISSEGAF